MRKLQSTANIDDEFTQKEGEVRCRITRRQRLTFAITRERLIHATLGLQKWQRSYPQIENSRQGNTLFALSAVYPSGLALLHGFPTLTLLLHPGGKNRSRCGFTFMTRINSGGSIPAVGGSTTTPNSGERGTSRLVFC